MSPVGELPDGSVNLLIFSVLILFCGLEYRTDADAVAQYEHLGVQLVAHGAAQHGEEGPFALRFGAGHPCRGDRADAQMSARLRVARGRVAVAAASSAQSFGVFEAEREASVGLATSSPSSWMSSQRYRRAARRRVSGICGRGSRPKLRPAAGADKADGSGCGFAYGTTDEFFVFGRQIYAINLLSLHTGAFRFRPAAAESRFAQPPDAENACWSPSPRRVPIPADAVRRAEVSFAHGSCSSYVILNRIDMQKKVIASPLAPKAVGPYSQAIARVPHCMYRDSCPSTPRRA